MNVLAVVKTVAKAAGRFAIKHRKGIIATVGGACVVGAVAYTAVQAPIAKEALESLPEPTENENKVDILVKKTRTVAPIMWPAVALTAGGIGCFVYVTHISAKAVSSAVRDVLAWKQAYNELAHIHNDYVNANRKIAGEEIHEKVTQEVNSQVTKRLGPNVMTVNTGKGDEIFFDSLSGQFFRSSATYISNAAMQFASDMHNFQLPNPNAMSGFGTAEEWLESYLLVNAPMTFDDIGWYDYDVDGFNTKYNPFKVYITDHFVTAPDGNPARMIQYDNLPIEP